MRSEVRRVMTVGWDGTPVVSHLGDVNNWAEVPPETSSSRLTLPPASPQIPTQAHLSLSQ
jgi:hypothetical protein